MDKITIELNQFNREVLLHSLDFNDFLNDVGNKKYYIGFEVRRFKHESI